MAEEILIPIGGAFTGATQSMLDARKKSDLDSPLGYYPSAFNEKTTSKRGILTIAKDRVPAGKNKPPVSKAVERGANTLEQREGLQNGKGKGFGIYYEVHGNGPIKMVFLMGLDNSCFGWLPQVECFSSHPSYSVLVLDNRGYGNSDTPSGFYKTSDMALDTLEILEHLGPEWSSKRSLNVIGVSMGGMIALEFAKLKPEIIISLNLISTTSGLGRGEKSFLTSLPPVSDKRKGLFNGGTVAITSIARILGGRLLNMDSDDYRIQRVCELLFPTYWLKEQSQVKGCEGRTNQEVMLDMFKFRFSFTRPPTPHGALAQIAAVMTHRVKNSELKEIDSKVPKILVITGDDDNLVNPGNSKHLADQMKRAEFSPFTGAGHAINMQFPEKLNSILQRSFKEGEEMVKNGGW